VAIRGVIFDLDGTLADTLPVCYAAFREVFETHLGQTYSDDDIHAMFGPSEEGIVARMLPERAEQGYRDYLAAYERRHVDCPATFAGIEAALELLIARGVRVAIVTAKGAGSAAISARVLGLERYFDILEAGSAAGNEKSRSIRTVLTRWELPPEEVAYVGDSIHDVRHSRAVGVLPLAVAWATTADVAALRAEQPAQLFTTVGDFTNWLATEAELG
jgi:phosphoglycolate phosphatase-like HAD superfamily hydrolase